jgi:tyrosine-protein phosphatase YwqE
MRLISACNLIFYIRSRFTCCQVHNFVENHAMSQYEASHVCGFSSDGHDIEKLDIRYYRNLEKSRYSISDNIEILQNCNILYSIISKSYISAIVHIRYYRNIIKVQYSIFDNIKILRNCDSPYPILSQSYKIAIVNTR